MEAAKQLYKHARIWILMNLQLFLADNAKPGFFSILRILTAQGPGNSKRGSIVVFYTRWQMARGTYHIRPTCSQVARIIQIMLKVWRGEIVLIMKAGKIAARAPYEDLRAAVGNHARLRAAIIKGYRRRSEGIEEIHDVGKIFRNAKKRPD